MGSDGINHASQVRTEWASEWPVVLVKTHTGTPPEFLVLSHRLGQGCKLSWGRQVEEQVLRNDTAIKLFSETRMRSLNSLREGAI